MKHRIRVGAIIVNDSKILLVKHVHPKTGFSWWVPPGGGIEAKDENIFECAKRETWEETGYIISTGDMLYIREFADLENDTRNIEIYLKGIIEGGQLTIENIYGHGIDELFIKEVGWLNREEVKNITVFPEIIQTDSFWTSIEEGTLNIQYLGKQEG